MKKHPQENAYLKKISKGKLPALYLKPRNSDTEEDYIPVSIKIIEIDDYWTNQFWKSPKSIKPICKMIKS